MAPEPRSRKRLLIPRLEVLLGVRYGRPLQDGLNVHAMGIRRTVLRKTIEGGHRALFVRVPLGASRAVLGSSPAAIAGRAVELRELWGPSAAQRLQEQLAHAPAPEAGAQLLREAVASRIEKSDDHDAHLGMVLAATELLDHEPVGLVADRLGSSERHFRRVFRDTVGVSPKTYARLRRFRRAVGLARRSDAPDWAAIAADTGFYDQAHLIAEFRAIGGAPPRALMTELRDAGALRAPHT